MTTPLFSPDLTDVLGAATQFALRNIHTASWGTIQSFDTSSSLATVQLVPRTPKRTEEGDRVAVPQAILQNVRVCFPGCGAVSMTWKPAIGDFVVILFMEQSMDTFLHAGGTDVDPVDDRRFSRNDAIAIPMHVEFGVTINPDSVVIDGPRIDLGDSGLNPLQDGVLTGQAIDPFTGSPHYALGNASTKVLAKK